MVWTCTDWSVTYQDNNYSLAIRCNQLWCCYGLGGGLRVKIYDYLRKTRFFKIYDIVTKIGLTPWCFLLTHKESLTVIISVHAQLALQISSYFHEYCRAWESIRKLVFEMNFRACFAVSSEAIGRFNWQFLRLDSIFHVRVRIWAWPALALMFQLRCIRKLPAYRSFSKVCLSTNPYALENLLATLVWFVLWLHKEFLRFLSPERGIQMSWSIQ